MELRYKDVDYSHCLSPRVAALPLHALKTPHTCSQIIKVESFVRCLWLRLEWPDIHGYVLWVDPLFRASH